MRTAEISQQPVIDFLSRPESHDGLPVTRIETHAAIVFLAGTRAIKIKRALRFPFLDFSTLKKRKRACEAELDVNRKFAPAIYRRVLAITRENDGHLAIGGKGPAVEWAVDMRRFDESQTLDHLAEHGRIDSRLAEALGRMTANAHALAATIERFDFSAALENVIAQNDAELATCPDLFVPKALCVLTERTHDALKGVHPLLVERGHDGFVRRCHGDLHLGNIVLIDGKPVLFDAIEFDERTATGDVLYDLAFLLMDLIQRGLQQAANIVLNRYLVETRHTSDLDTLAALPLFMAVRAAIRAKVTAARRAYSKTPAKVSERARDYFALAERLIAPRQPQLIAVGGLSGTGKSHLAHALAPLMVPAPGAIVLRSDIERKAMFDVDETERLPPNAYSPQTGQKLYAGLAAKAARILRAGHSVIIDAVFADPLARAEIRKVAVGRKFFGLFLTANLETRIARVRARKHDISDADVAVARAQEHYELGPMDWVKVDASGAPDETLRRAKVALLK